MKENYLCLLLLYFTRISIFYIQRISENSDHKASAKATQNANQIEDKMKLRFSIVFIIRNNHYNSQKRKGRKGRKR